jgi:hypothetical protein
MRLMIVGIVALGLVSPAMGADREARDARQRGESQRSARAAGVDTRGLQRTDGEYALSPQQAMWAKISEVKFEQVALRDALAWVQETLGTNMHVDWGALAEAGVTPDQPVNIDLKWVRVPRLLQLLFQETGRGDELTYYVADNILVITSRAVADAEVFTRVYPVQDLVLQPSKVERPDRSVLSPQVSGGTAGTSGGGFGGGGNEDAWGGRRGDDDDDDDDDDDSDKDRGQKLVEMVKSMTPSSIWEENGGKSKITYFRGNLVLTAPRSVHALIGGPIRE